MDDRSPSLAFFSSNPHTATRWSRESILFSACNEDTRSELSAFGSVADKRILCVTAGGGRVLGLLADRPKAVVAVDLNPAQNALLELKIAAMRALDHDGYLRFLGVRADDRRESTYAKLRSVLSPAAQRFFDRNASGVRAGILFHGKLERFLGWVSVATRAAHPFGLRHLLDARTVDEQRALMDGWETPLWRTLAQFACRRSVLALLSGDPGFYRNLPPELPLHEMLYDRIHRYLRDNVLRDNALLQLVFFGRYVWEPALPIYLHAETFGQVKAALEDVEIQIVTATVEDALRADKKTFDAFSLSDISSYLDNDAHHQLFERVLLASSHEARLCSRANIYHRPLAAEHARRLHRDQALERRLAKHDHACVHEFVVGSVK